MLKNIAGSESYIHICDAGKNKPEIGLHDLQAYIITGSSAEIEAKRAHMTFIKYCPYCGVEVEKDIVR